jgi:ubiquitin carboxyl-terminal hydrolase 25/28
LIAVLQSYADEIEKKENKYKRVIEKIEEEIEKCYESIRTEPYILNSILIHEGSAEMGHYYSYVFDIETNSWKKYNDINISDESPEQVFKEAKGHNVTSAYYLVYVLKDVLSTLGSQSTVRNYSMST